MNKKKTTVKGFTLIELIIVLAIFSVIMTLVMSFIDPVSKIMTKTSVRERTAAYVDNIGEYVSKSIRHSQNIWVYEHGLDGDEETLVTDFVNTYYDGAVNEKLERIKLKVHVLKLINEDEGSLKAGRIYESVYSCTTGMGKPATAYTNKYTYDIVDAIPDGANADDYIESDIRTYGPGFPSASVDSVSPDVSVINDEHFKDYSYYYQLGMYTFDPITTPENHGLTSDSKYFYSRLNKMMKGADEISDGVDAYQFVMNVVSFMDNAQNTDNKINCPVPDGEGHDPVDTESFVAFKSPAAMSSVGMTFKNAQLQGKGNVVSYYRIKFDKDGDKLDTEGNKITDDSIVPDIEPVRNDDTPNPFRRITDGTSDNIYMIFTVPTEIMDTEWKDATPQPATSGGPFLPVA